MADHSPSGCARAGIPVGDAFNDEWKAELARMAARRDEEDDRARRRRFADKPAWWFDRGFVNSVALEFLPAATAAMGYTTACAMWLPGQVRWWPAGEPGHVIMLADAAGGAVFIDRASGYWVINEIGRRGLDLIGLAALRWRVSEAKAAWRLARLCGLRRPHG